MNGVAKLLVISICFVICGVGVMFAPALAPMRGWEKLNATPVKNHEAAPRIWMEV